VVCDRFADSTLAYQCFGQGVKRAVFDGLAEVALGALRPDLTVLLDLPPEAGLARAAARGENNRYEALDPAFHARVRTGFLSVAEAEPARCVVADATDSPEGVAAAILAAVQNRLSPP
jgi:dTMP kinase